MSTFDLDDGTVLAWYLEVPDVECNPKRSPAVRILDSPAERSFRSGLSALGKFDGDDPLTAGWLHSYRFLLIQRRRIPGLRSA
jgi:hypothetical protein